MTLSINSLGPSALELHIEGKLGKSDFERFVPLAEERIRTRGKVSLLVDLSNLAGWSPSALWEDLKFDVKHYRDVSRLALVSEDSSKQWMATLSKPFTGAEVRFFEGGQVTAAREWVQGTPLTA